MGSKGIYTYIRMFYLHENNYLRLSIYGFLRVLFVFKHNFIMKMNSTPYERDDWSQATSILELEFLYIYIYIDTYVLSSWEQLFKSVYLLFLKGTFHFQTHFIMKINSLHMKSDDWSQARAKKFLRIRIQRNKQNLARKNKNFCHN